MPPHSHQQILIDQLQIAAPLSARLLVTARQQHVDAQALMAAVETALAALASLTRAHLPAPHPGERKVRQLELAMVRSTHTIDEVAHLTAIPRARLLALVNGAAPTADERTALSRVLLDWDGSQ